ncbi:sensor histidine kinase [Bdellovibrio sp. HCB185ZH]|uniref:sensor histidine kinase n=1 Tax=Bdellovibrio sp. HCB185ZH TaxID=3394235 RepID=UPI0039A468AE
MKFSKKVFLTIFGIGVLTTVAISLILNITVTQRLNYEFEDSYLDHMNLLSKTLILLDQDKDVPTLNSLFEEMIHHDVDNLSVKLVDQGGKILGHVNKDGYADSVDLETLLPHPDGVVWIDGQMIVLTSFKYKNDVPYRLVATISTASIDREIRDIHMILLATAAGLIIASLLLSQILTKTLLRKVGSIHSTLEDITHSQNYAKRVSVVADSHDEIDGLGSNLNRMLETLQISQSQLLEAERDKARSQVAAQVAHDIRSPLMSMNMALAQIETKQLEPLAILKSAIARVAGIVQKLSAASVKSEESTGVENPKLTLVEPLVASVVSEQNVRRSDSESLKIKGLTSQPQIWSVVQVNELQTVISNLINNAFEAGASHVDLQCGSEGKEWTLAIKDNGSGMSADVLERIFDRGFTHGKTTGSGLGLFHAKSVIDWNGGRLVVKTTVGQGTTFTIHLPREKTPPWLPAHIEMDAEQPIAFVDDDSNVLKAWKEKAIAAGLKQASFFSSIAELEQAHELRQILDSGVIVIDHNLSDAKKGLEFLGEIAIGKRSYLCTSDFDEKRIQDKVRSLGINMIPKPWITLFEIRLRNS